MAQEQRLELRLTQKLILTPQLQQSIKLLQLPLLELSQDINQELMSNPLLEEGADRDPDEKNEQPSAEEAYRESSGDIEAPLEKYSVLRQTTILRNGKATAEILAILPMIPKRPSLPSSETDRRLTFTITCSGS